MRNWIRFACHGIQDAEHLAEQYRTLAPSHCHAPLRAQARFTLCMSAMGDKDLSDQAIHIAAGMLFAGYRGLISILWSITERVAPRVTRHYVDERNMPSVRFNNAVAPRHEVTTCQPMLVQVARRTLPVRFHSLCLSDRFSFKSLNCCGGCFESGTMCQHRGVIELTIWSAIASPSFLTEELLQKG